MAANFRRPSNGSVDIAVCGNGSQEPVSNPLVIAPFTALPLNHVMTPEELLGAERWYRRRSFKQHLQPNDVHYELGAG